MAHQYKITRDSETVKSPDPELPLIDTSTHSQFAAKASGKLQGGRIYPQLVEVGGKKRHPSMFYVEFPYASGNFTEISLKKLAALLGEGGGDRIFTTTTAATILNAIPRSFNFPNLLRTIRP